MPSTTTPTSRTCSSRPTDDQAVASRRHARPTSGQGVRHHRRRERHRRGSRADSSARRAPRSSASTSAPIRSATAIEADVTTDEEPSRPPARLPTGRIDILFNNAGINPPDDQSVLDLAGLEVVEQVQRVSTTSVFLCCKHGDRTCSPTTRPAARWAINTASFVAVMGAAVSRVSHRLGRGAGDVARARRQVRAAVASGSTRSAQVRSMRRSCRSCSPRIREGEARRLVPLGRFAEAPGSRPGRVAASRARRPS